MHLDMNLWSDQGKEMTLILNSNIETILINLYQKVETKNLKTNPEIE